MELPLNVPYLAKVDLIQKCFVDWKEISDECFIEIQAIAERHLSALARDTFSRYEDLYQAVQ